MCIFSVKIILSALRVLLCVNSPPGSTFSVVQSLCARVSHGRAEDSAQTRCKAHDDIVIMCVKTHLPGQAGFFSSMHAEAQQDMTETKIVSDFSHPAICTVLNDCGAFWSTAATPPHCQTKLGGEDISALPLPHSVLVPLTSHSHLCAFSA